MCFPVAAGDSLIVGKHEQSDCVVGDRNCQLAGAARKGMHLRGTNFGSLEPLLLSDFLPGHAPGRLDNQASGAYIGARFLGFLWAAFPPEGEICMSNTFVRRAGVVCLGLVTLVFLLTVAKRVS